MYRDFFHQKYTELRLQAEDKLAQGQAHAKIPLPVDIEALKHEVAVQQIELEMQHDELLKSHHELGELRAQAERGRIRYQQFFNLTSAGLLVLNTRGVITECNKAAADVLGQDAAGLVGRTLAEFVSPPDRMNFDILFKQEINNQSGNRIGVRLSDKKEKTTPVSLAVTVLEQGIGSDKEYLVTLVNGKHE
ncbi:MAG: PAS domain S-box protein [Gallionella sp.]|nr:PAS domain S-box protein [Gallionella sp.]